MSKSILQSEKECYVTHTGWTTYISITFSMAMLTARRARSGVVGYG